MKIKWLEKIVPNLLHNELIWNNDKCGKRKNRWKMHILQNKFHMEKCANFSNKIYKQINYDEKKKKAHILQNIIMNMLSSKIIFLLKLCSIILFKNNSQLKKKKKDFFSRLKINNNCQLRFKNAILLKPPVCCRFQLPIKMRI